MGERKVIVNADDYGLTREVSRGIRLAHQQGIVTSTTVMMNMPLVEEDLATLSRETPSLALGVHLTLTAGQPVLSAAEVKTLIDKQENFFGLRELQKKVSDINLEEVRLEWKTQIEKLLGLGYYPDHLDSHHHISYRNFDLFSVMLSLAHEYNLPIRSIPFQLEQEKLEKTQQEYGVISPEKVVTNFFGDSLSNAFLIQLLNSVKSGTIELMVHPGYSDSRLLGMSSYTWQRVRELHILSSPRIRDFIHRGSLTLTNFSAVQNS